MVGRRRVTVTPPPRRPPEERKRKRAAFWADRERRRALLLSLLVHGGVFLVTARLYALPPRALPEPPEQVIVLELTPLTTGAQETEAAVTPPAPQSDTVQSAGNAPQDTAPPAPAPSPPRTEPAPAPELATAAPPSESPPTARTPGGGGLPDLPVSAPASTLPEIEPVQVSPQPPQEAVALPTPEPEAAVTPERRVAVTPQASVTASEAVPTPEVAAEIATREVALPQIETAVAAEGAIPSPTVGAAVVQAERVPQPDVRAEVAEAVPQPQAGASVAEAQAVPQPQAGAVVSAAQGVPQPAVSGSAGAAGALPTPQVGADVAAPRSLAVTPGAAVGAAVPIAVPGASATVAPSAARRASDAGNGARSTQTTPDPAASGEGAASDGSGAASVGVASLEPYAATVEHPLAVLIDNADAAYPQQGLVEASTVLEFPVEGGLTRLMSVYTRSDPVQVGPIRSARDYFLEAALAMNGTLVHVGGEPSAVDRIASQDLATLDALARSDLFAQAPDRAAPHRTFSTGTALRDAVGRLPVPVSGTLYTPPSTAPDAAAVTAFYSADYSSAFRFVQELDRYVWVRNGTDAADTAGEAVTADAVVVAQVFAIPKSGDLEGRLYLPYTGGAATLYLGGKAIPGSWTPANGFSFFGENGVEVDLTPFKSWVMFAPEGTQVSTQ